MLVLAIMKGSYIAKVNGLRTFKSEVRCSLHPRSHRLVTTGECVKCNKLKIQQYNCDLKRKLK